MKTTRLLLADDHALVRAGIRSLLERMPAIEVVGEAGDGREALARIRQLKPEVVLLDIAMPGLNGLEALIRARREFPRLKVIILSMLSNEEYVVQALNNGALGYLLKDSAVAELEIALTAVIEGHVYLSPRISKRVIDGYLDRVGNHHAQPQKLTPRQREIVQLVAEGKTTKDIAFILGLSVKTVDAHRAQLMDKLGVHDVPGLVRYAMRAGLVPPEAPPD